MTVDDAPLRDLDHVPPPELRHALVLDEAVSKSVTTSSSPSEYNEGSSTTATDGRSLLLCLVGRNAQQQQERKETWDFYVHRNQ